MLTARINMTLTHILIRFQIWIFSHFFILIYIIYHFFGEQIIGVIIICLFYFIKLHVFEIQLLSLIFIINFIFEIYVA
jgi:hypothetical protein